MSMNVLQEFLIHFHTFRNIDLLNQGLYQIRSRIFYSDSDNHKRNYAIPYYYTESKEIESILQTDEVSIKPHNIIPNHINEGSYEYIPKTFLVRYSDEEVELDEFCYFRIEFPHNHSPTDFIFSIEFELFFSDALNSLGKPSKNTQGATTLSNNVEFKSVSTQLVLLSADSMNYVESFCPIVYVDNFSSVLNISIHKLVLDYKLRVNNIKPFTIEVETVIPKKDKKDGMMSKEKKSINSLIQFLVSEELTSNVVDESVIDDLYNKYVISLVHNYLTLRTRFVKLSNRLIDDKNKSEYSFFTSLPQLKVYKDQRDCQELMIGNEDDSYSFVHKIFRLSNRIFSNSTDYVAQRIFLEINFIASQIYQLWHKYVELIRHFPAQTNYIMHCEYKRKIHNDLLKFVKKSIISVTESSNLVLPIENNIPENNKTYAVELRKSLVDIFSDYHFENTNNHIRPSIFPVLFEESYIRQQGIEAKKIFYDNNCNWEKESASVFLNESVDFVGKNPTLCLHLVVLVHGFQGNAYDMRLIKNAIGLENPSCVFLSSSSNQDDTETDIMEMGKKLANEVKSYLADCNGGSIFNKISFIGHSIGGLIIRAALLHLEELSNKLWIYMSLSSPHLGYIYSSNTLFNAGMWVLKQWRKSRSLEQLMLSDEKDMKDCCLFKLSDYEGLNWFTHVYLISSHQDNYAPYESTRIQLCYKSLDDNHKGNIYRNMAFNILSKMTRDTLKRIDVNFYIAEKNLDTLIGRTAHIQFLENTDFMKILFSSMHDIL